MSFWIITLSYFSFNLAAFFSYGCFSSADELFHISPNFFAVSPMERPGYSLFIFGRKSAQKRKNADLWGGEKETKQKNTLLFNRSKYTYSLKENEKCDKVLIMAHTVVSWGHWGPWIASSSGPWEARNSSFPAHNATCLAWPCLQTCLSLLVTLSLEKHSQF